MTYGFQKGLIETLDDIIYIYQGIYKKGDTDVRYGLNRLLKMYLVRVISGDVKEEHSQTLDFGNKISAFIRKNEEVSPYSDLPQAEQNIIIDLSTFIDNGDTHSVKRKLQELAGMIQVRSDELTKNRNIKTWTLPLSVIGWLLTIVFGILALIN